MGRTLELKFAPPVLATDGQRLSKPMEIEIFRSISAAGKKPVPISIDQLPWLTLAPSDWLALLKSQPPSLPSEPAVNGKGRSQTGTAVGKPRPESLATRVSDQQKEDKHGPVLPGALKAGGRAGKKRRSGPSVPESSKVVERYTLSEQEFDRLQGSMISFAARGITRGFRNHAIEGDLSNVVKVTLLDVSPPVQGVVAEQPTERAVEVRWIAPVRTLTGNPISGLAGYRLYKSDRGTPDSFVLLGQTVETKFEDVGFGFGETYFYQVRAVFKRRDQIAESEDSLSAKITLVDTFPPAAPSGLTGLYSAGAVELIWNASFEPDLAGYNVYRRENSGQSRRINAESLSTPIFRDTSAEPGHAYSYWVTAVDLAHNESSPSPAVEVETR